MDSCWVGYSLTTNFRDLYLVGLTHLSSQPSFLIVLQHGVSSRARPAISSRSCPQCLHPGRKVTCCKVPELETPLQNKTGDPNIFQSRGDATARVSTAKTPREQSPTHRPAKVLRSLQSKTKQGSKQDLDYVRE